VDADDPGVAVDDAAGVHGHAQSGLLDLALAAAAPELVGQLDDLGQTGGTEGMAAPEQATAGVDHEARGVDRGHPGLCRRSGFAVAEEAERLEGIDLLCRRGVVQFDHVGVVGPEAEGLPGRLGGVGQTVVVVE
jgi:hypothetical protein